MLRVLLLLVLLTASLSGAQTLVLFTAKTTSGSDIKPANRPKAEYPSTITSNIKVQEASYLHAILDLDKGVAPKQVFLRFSHKKLDYSGILTFSKKKGAGNSYSLVVATDSQFKEYVGEVGEFGVDVLIAGGNVTKPIEWKAASATVELQPAAAKKKSRYEPGHLITHIFRGADKRAPHTFAYAFTALNLAPLVLFLYLIGRIGFKFSRPTHLFYTLIFLASIAAILGLLVIYWIGISIFTAFQLLSLFGLVAIFSGLRAFRPELAQISASKKNQ